MGKTKKKGAKGKAKGKQAVPQQEVEVEVDSDQEEGSGSEDELRRPEDDAGAGQEENDGAGKKETRGQIIQRHKREQRELKTKTGEMLHSYNKADKKAKQQTMDAIKKLEEELKKKQEEELAAFDRGGQEEKAASVSAVQPAANAKEPSQSQLATKQGGKTQKKKAKKAAQEAALRAKIEEEKKNTVSQRQVELTQIQKRLQPLKFKIFEISADGNCLFNAVAHQLKLTRPGDEKASWDCAKMRKLVAEFMTEHSDEFLPFYDSEESDLAAAFARHCSLMASTSAWGGQLELKALVQLLKQAIVVHNASGPPVEMGEEFKSNSQYQPLHLTYHRHFYALGEHYNSTIDIHSPLAGDEEDEEEETEQEAAPST